MAIKIIPVRNLDTGAVGKIREDWYNNPKINPGILEEVEPGAKPYLEGYYTSRFHAEDAKDSQAEESDTEEDAI